MRKLNLFGRVITYPPSGRVTSTSNKLSARRPWRKSRHSTPSEDGKDSSSDEDVDYRTRRIPRRFSSVSATSNIQPSYTPHATPSHPLERYPPVADPRAQQIITSAMQQLAALLWTPPAHSSPATPLYPYTPILHRYSSVGPNFMHSTPDHPHPYPFSFDPSFSRATLPPSSPEPPSSPTKPREGRKSLVSRSHSRGRRVSFCVNERNGSSESGSESSTSDCPRKTSDLQRRNEGSPTPQRTKSKVKGKDKEKAVERHTSFEYEAEADEYLEEERSTKLPRVRSVRAQTPGPETKSQGKVRSSSRTRSFSKGSSKPGGKFSEHGRAI